MAELHVLFHERGVESIYSYQVVLEKPLDEVNFITQL